MTTRPFQSGITLMLAILVLLVLTFVGLGLLYFVQTDSVVSSNVATQAAALEASDAGLAQANRDLQSLSQYPQYIPSMTQVSWWYVPPPIAGTTTITPQAPTVQNSQFWVNCASGTHPTCGAVLVPFAGYKLTAEFVVEATGLRPQTLNGYEAGSGGGPSTYEIYDAFVHVQGPGLSGNRSPSLNSDVEAALRKGG